MSQVLTISDSLYARLEATVHAHGLSSIEELIQQLIEIKQSGVNEPYSRQEVVNQIDALHERLSTTYGEMTDSVELIRADRAR